MDATKKFSLTDRQKWALYKLVTGVRDKNLKEQSLGGYAGTGKSTIIKYLIQFFPDFGVAAYTGKAGNILRKKGIPASTIHSKIYKPFFDNGVIYFDLNPDPGCNGFIIDEASMVPQDIYDDLKSYNMPMIFIGDHGQLEPVNSKLNLMESPMYTLEEIHRNAGDIAKFCESIRKKLPPKRFKCSDDSVEFLYGRNIDSKILTEVDQIICAFNSTRVAVNAQVRELQGYKGHVNVGEKIMCLRNNRKQGLFNGMQGIVKNLYEIKSKYYLDFDFDGTLMEGICYDPETFGQESYKMKMNMELNPFDYANCITAHKAQGDEWESVLVIEQRCNKWDHIRWAYTSGSRAESKLYWKLAA